MTIPSEVIEKAARSYLEAVNGFELSNRDLTPNESKHAYRIVTAVLTSSGWGEMREALEWRPIETAPKDDEPDEVTGLPPQILLGCIFRGQLLWAAAAVYARAMPGYIQCASRSGWLIEYAPELAEVHQRFGKGKTGWITPSSPELAPTHWKPLDLPSPPLSIPKGGTT